MELLTNWSSTCSLLWFCTDTSCENGNPLAWLQDNASFESCLSVISISICSPIKCLVSKYKRIWKLIQTFKQDILWESKCPPVLSINSTANAKFNFLKKILAFWHPYLLNLLSIHLISFPKGTAILSKQSCHQKSFQKSNIDGDI